MLGWVFNNESSRKFRRFLSRHGIVLRLSKNARPIDLRDRKEIHPLSALYENPGRDVILRVSSGRCVFNWLHFDGLSKESKSAKIKTIIEYMNGAVDEYEKSSLSKFYGLCQPKNAAEMLGLINPTYQDFSYLPASAAVLPWMKRTPIENIKRMENTCRSELRQFGKGPERHSFNQFFGPVSESFGMFEFERLVAVFESINEKGFLVDREGFNNINATLLVDDGVECNYLCFINDGQHRAAALAALGMSWVDVQLKSGDAPSLVYRSEVNHWPLVRRGYFSCSEALGIFDRCFKSVNKNVV